MSTVDLIANDPVLAAMAKGDIPWGDLLISYKDVPILKTRKDVWKAFPVKLIPLRTDMDGAERHAVAWDYARFTSNMGSQGYEKSMRGSLLNALKASTKWVVETTVSRYCICVIRMVFHGYRPEEETKANRASTLNALTDIYKFFPAVVYALKSGVYSIELHSKRMEKLSEIKGYDTSEEVRSELVEALKNSSSWRVLPAKLPCEVCRIVRGDISP